MYSYVTPHCYNRGKERTGLGKKGFLNLTRKARAKNISTHNTKGKLRSWIENKVSRNSNRTAVAYGSYLFICSKHSVITVINLPREFIPIKKYLIKDI